MSTKKLQIIGSLGGGASVELDSTLTQSGKAADAKAVGDALLEAANNTHEHSNKEVLDQISSTVDIYTTATAPVDAEEGSIWIDAGSNTDGPSIYVRKNGTWAMSSDGKTQKQSDWNEVDGASAAYIRNKPFGYMEDVFANSNMPFTLFKNSVYYGSISYDIFDGVVTGDEITVVWDGTPYNVTAKQIVVNIDGVTTMTVSNAMGNAKIAADAWANSSDDDSGEPFIILPGLSRIFTKSTLATHSVIVKFKDNVVKIDPKFLPDEVATHEYVQEQIEAIPDVDISGLATVEYVDEQISAVGGMQNQIQADWNETDENSYAFIKNKPASFGIYEHPETHPASMITGLANVATSGSYNDLSDKPVIPSIEGFATEAYVDEKIASINVSGSGSENVILETQKVDGFMYMDALGLYGKGNIGWFDLEPGKEYRVAWDGEVFTCKAYEIAMNGYNAVVLGNEAYAKGESSTTVEPFSIYRVQANGYCCLASFDTETSHEVGIYEVKDSSNVSVQANWDQIDPAQPDYIKNRPFYEYEGRKEIIPVTKYGGFYLDSDFGVYSYEEMKSYDIAIGETYIVSWDGVEYECIAQDAGVIIDGVIGLGNAAPFGLLGNNEPFVFAFMPGVGIVYFALTDTVDGNYHTVGVYQNTILTKQIDKKFIPIPYFGSSLETKELIPACDLSFVYEEGDGYVYNDTPSTEQLQMWQDGWTSLTVIWDGVEYACEPQKVEGIKCVGNVDLMLGVGDNGMPFVMMMADASIFGQDVYMILSLVDTTTGDTNPDVTHNIAVAMNVEDITTIDSKYITDVSWGKITDKPFGTVPAGTVVVPATTVVCIIELSDGVYGGFIDEPNIGDFSYNVEFDGVVYNCVGTTDSDGCTGLVGENFRIIRNYGGYHLVVATQGEHTFKVTLAEDAVTKIDVKYLPDSLGAGGSNLPEVDTTQNGQVMTVVNGEWKAQSTTHPTELPAVTVDDAGKFLRVGADGSWIVELIQDVSEVGL